MLAVDRDEIQSNSKHNTPSEKAVISTYFSRGGFASIEFFPDGQKYKSLFFTETVSPGIKRKLAESRPKLRPTAADLHIDNARPHM
jgi:hypothetical protein